MAKPSQISIYKSLLRLRYPFHTSRKPISPFSLNSLAPTQTQLGPDSVPPSPNLNFPPSPASKSKIFPNPIDETPQNYFQTHQNRSFYSTELGGSHSVAAEFDQNREVDMINLKFAEAREEIEMAMESKETAYFDEEAECARIAVKEVLNMFDGLLKKLPESERASLQRSMGLKMEQLNAELQQLND